jgi:hypothetical protein
MLRIPALALLLVSLALSACGGGGDDEKKSSGDAGGAKAYADAVRALDDVRSGAFEAQVEAELAGGQRLQVQERGRFEGGGGLTLPQFSLLFITEQSSGPGERSAAINTGEDFYVKQNGAPRFVAQGAESVKQLEQTFRREQQDLGEGRLPLLALAPGDWAKEPKVEGTETVDGVPAQRIVAKLDVPRFLRDLETGKNADIGMGVSLTAAARQVMEPGAKMRKAELVALIGQEDKRLHRLTASMDAEAAGGVRVDFEVSLRELDEPQEIAAPG